MWNTCKTYSRGLSLAQTQHYPLSLCLVSPLTAGKSEALWGAEYLLRLDLNLVFL